MTCARHDEARNTFLASATLLIVQGIEAGTRFDLGDRPVTLGRGNQCDFRILDTEASRHHAVIEPAGDGFVLTDQHSSNGTIVNGETIARHELVNGDQIQIGRTLLLFTINADEEDALSPAERVELPSRPDPHDRSSIVSQVDFVSGDLMRPQGEFPSRQSTSDQNLGDLRTLYRISEEAVRPSASIEQILTRILQLTLGSVDADRGCILLRSPQSGELLPSAIAERTGRPQFERMQLSRSIVDQVLKSEVGIRTTDAQHDARFETAASVVQAGIREAMCVPVRGRHEMLGVLYVDITSSLEQMAVSGRTARFDEDHLRLLLAIGRQAALAIETNRYQEAFVRAERFAAIGQTIATLSHHIKNILQGVRGGSYLIDIGLKDHSEELVRKGWTIVEKNQNKIYDLVMDMLTFSKERQPLLRLADLNETVTDVVDLMRLRAHDGHVNLELTTDSEIPLSTFDAEGINRAVLNVVTNAIDACEETTGGQVAIHTGFDATADSLWVSVTDNGPGIPEAQIGKLFQVFESTKGARGTGLGLPVSQKIIREHGGDITVKTELGKGTKFTLSWPRHDEEHAQTGNTQEFDQLADEAF
jgi:two-component system, NtrC family, sensor kinase